VTAKASNHSRPKTAARYTGRYTAIATTPPRASAYSTDNDVPDASRTISTH